MGGTLFNPVRRRTKGSYALEIRSFRIFLKRGNSRNVINKHCRSHAHPTLDKILKSGHGKHRGFLAKPSKQAGKKHYREGKIKYFFHAAFPSPSATAR